MIACRHTENSGPLTWIGRFPVYAGTVLAGAHALTMVLTAVAMAAGAEALLQAFVFSSGRVLHDHALWQAATYAFVHRPPYWLFLFELYLLAVFGAEIEKDLGRRAFVGIYLALLLLPPVMLAAAGLCGIPSIYAGSSALHFGVFVAFAVLNPSAEVFFTVQARWVALALLAVSSLQCLAVSDFVSLGVLLLDCAAAYALARQLRYGDILPARAAAERLEAIAAPSPRPVPLEKALDAIDPILEKISRSGLASLTPRERARLEQARADLIAKDGGR